MKTSSDSSEQLSEYCVCKQGQCLTFTPELNICKSVIKTRLLT